LSIVQELKGVESVDWLPFDGLKSYFPLLISPKRHLRFNTLLTTAIASVFLSHGMAALAASHPSNHRKNASVTINTDRQFPLLGVAIEEDHVRWQSPISDRLERINQPFQFIEWDRVQQLDDIRDVDLLLLANIQQISQRQLQVLDQWIEQGGELIISGHLGEQSSSLLQARLRSLLGAYWAFSLPETARLQVDEDHPQHGVAGAPSIDGGIIVPTRLGSETLATWEPASNGAVQQRRRGEGFSRRINVGNTGAPAVVKTEVATFIGWNWGNPQITNAEFDAVWLQSILPHHRSNESFEAASVNQARPARSQVGLTEATSPAEANPPVESEDLTGVRGDRPTEPTASRQSEDSDMQALLPLAPSTDEDFIDPTQQIAPAGLEVHPDDRPIHILEKLSMTQELENLIGRFESALLASQVHAAEPDNIGRQDSVLIASRSRQPGIASELARSPESNTYARVMEHPALVQAKALLEAFPDLVNNRQYGEARQSWLEARQILWENFPTDRPIAQPEVRAIWLDRGTIVEAGSRQRLAEIFDQLANAGINTVFVETVNAGYPIYPSDVAPQQNPLIQGWDPLAAAVELAHARGIEAHAWVWVFAAGNQRHNAIANLPRNYPGPILAAHPSWANADRQGRAIPVGQDKPFLDPANPEVRQYLQQLYEEIVTNYDVDGLHLDYIRYPFQNAASGNSYGYGTASRQRFRELTGVDPLQISPGDRRLWQQWTEFRMEQVNSFVAETAENIRAVRSDLVLSAAVFAMSEHERIQKLQQHWESWARAGTIDMIVTMSYASDTHRFQQLTSPWLLEAELGSTLVVPGIQLFNLSEAAAFDQIQSLRDTPAGGYALFAVEHLNDDLRSIFNRTQGTEDIPLAPVPFREPFTTASARFDALQYEWNFLLENGAFWVRPTQREDMIEAIANMQAMLDELSTESTAQDIRHVQETFQTFTTQFEEWSYLHSFSQRYRVNSWNQRLDMIALLLSYGGDRLSPN
jgi:uncharacterized lipoprotein YddW (UPF0748 family)